MHHNFENCTWDPLKYTMGSPKVIVSICMGPSIRIHRVKFVWEIDKSNAYMKFGRKHVANNLAISSTKEDKHTDRP